MRSYGQYCAAACALDVIGDRWSLLIVRELLIRPCRYTDLRHGLPGIASNLLADRLRQLEHAGVLEREQAPPPIATTLYQLTARGHALTPVIRELGRWGAPLLEDSVGDAAFRSHWLAVPIEAIFAPGSHSHDAVVQIETGDQPLVLHAGADGVQVRPGNAPHPDLTIAAEPVVVLDLLAGDLEPAAAIARGARLVGDTTVLERLTAQAD